VDEQVTRSEPLDALLEAAVDAIVISDRDGVMVRVNAAATRMFGYETKQMLGQNVRMLMPDPDHSQHARYIQNYHDGGKPRIIGLGREVTALHADGNSFPIHLSIGEIAGQERARFVAIIRDLSRLKATQDTVKELETHLAHADRLVVLGELTAGIAHEINQPLTAIAAFADAGSRLLDSKAPGARDELCNVCSRISQQARRAGDVVNRLRRLARRGDLSKTSHHVDAMVNSVLLLFEHELKNSGITIETSFEPGLPLVIVDEIQIQQVLVNLVKNSIDALQASGTRLPKILVQAQRRGAMLEIDVLDNGPGVPEDFVNRLFEPFYTTKMYGVGLGLSICKNIAVAHGGKLAYGESRLGGARFTLSLPLSVIG
jgi:two-component system sensor kinase FixL